MGGCEGRVVGEDSGECVGVLLRELYTDIPGSGLEGRLCVFGNGVCGALLPFNM